MEAKLVLDEISWTILRALQENARLSYSELGRRVKLTPPAVAERVRRLEEAGVIVGYHAELDALRVGLPLTAFIRVKCYGGRCSDLGTFVLDLPEVLECHRVTGEESYVMKVMTRSVDHLQELIDLLMPYGDTTTSVVLSSPVSHRALDPALLAPGEEAKRISESA